MNSHQCASCPNGRNGNCPLSRRLGVVIEELEPRQHLAAVNPIVAENQLPGTPESVWEVTDAGDPTIQGFATDISVDVGQTVSFKVDDPALAKYHIDIYRMGYYQGNGARLVTTVPSSQVLRQDQPDPIKDNQTGLIDCGNWAVSASWAVSGSAVSGIYIADLVREDTGGKSSIYFIVRNDASHSDLLFQTSDTTWEAYNSYGGNSLYVGSSAATAGQPVSRAVEVSYNRPLVVQGKYGGLDSFNGPLHAEYPMVRWLEANGYDVTYFTGVDADRRGAEILQHKVYLSVGHDEYWSGGQRANVDAARGAGVSMAFFSGNEIYWKVRWEESVDGSGTAYRTMVCYKETHAQRKSDPEPGVWTGQWRDPRFGPHDGNLPENETSGQMFSVNADTTDLGAAIQVPAAFAKMRLWRDTSVASLTGSQVATMNANTLGYEWDEDVDNGFRPDGLFDLSSTTRTVPQKLIDFYSGYGAPCPGCTGKAGACGCTVGQDAATHSLTLYKDQKSGALVFGAGTVQWSWGLDSHHIDGTSTPDVRMEQATVNLFADMQVQAGSLMSGLKAETASTDATAPTAIITSPTKGASVPFGEGYTITGTATDAGGGQVAGVEVSVDGGETWHPATGRGSWSYTWNPGVGGAATILARAVDDSGNLQGNPASVNVTTPGPTDQTMFGAATPFISAEADAGSVEVGTKFRVDVGGEVTGIRFYKGAGNTGTHVGNLWTGDGELLGSVTFTDETAEGWQYALLSTPVAVEAGRTYVVSYFAPNGHYADDQWYFDIRGAGGQQVHALEDGEDGPNGVFKYGARSAFPDNEYQAANYYVDVLFRAGEGDTSPPVVTGRSPAAGAVGIATDTTVSAVFNESVQAGSVVFTLKDASGTSAAGTVAYDEGARTATYTPAAGLAAGVTYTASVSAEDLAGNEMSAVTWTFMTASAEGTETIFGDATPTVAADPDNVPIELGVKFTTDVDGTVDGIRFYKGAGNTGTHSGTLWTEAGVRLATAMFVDETASGWQTVLFDSPVEVTAGTVYVASYFAPNGHYAADDNYFVGQGAGAGQVHALANGESGVDGVYRYAPSSAFPSSGYRSTNYWVDVVFTPGTPADTTPPTVTGTSPANGATGVGTGTSLGVTFDEGVTASSVAFTVRDGGGAFVAGTIGYDDATRTATFTPTGGLAAGETYTVSVSASDVAGNAMVAPYVWSFTTAAQQTGAEVSIWDDTDVPAVAADPDAVPIEVGVKFRSDVAGFVTGIRFYKASTNTGAHVGHLWSADGTLLATATFVDETASGWQTVRFDRPVAIEAGVTYVASYHMDAGHYSVTENGFGAGGEDNGPLHALGSGVDGGNGVYAYGGEAFPTQTYRASNYWVDVLFEPDVS